MTARSPTMITLHYTRFVECQWWNDCWTVKTVVTLRSSASMIPTPGEVLRGCKVVQVRICSGEILRGRAVVKVRVNTAKSTPWGWSCPQVPTLLSASR